MNFVLSMHKLNMFANFLVNSVLNGSEKILSNIKNIFLDHRDKISWMVENTYVCAYCLELELN